MSQSLSPVFLWYTLPGFDIHKAVLALRTHLLVQLLIVAQSFSISLRQNKDKIFCEFTFFRGFSKFYEKQNSLSQFFVIWRNHKPSLELYDIRSRTKLGPDQHSRSDVYSFFFILIHMFVAYFKG